VPGAEAKAREYLAVANASGKDLADRYGAEALQLVSDGKSAEAEELIDGLRKKGASSNKLWFGLAAAYESEGNLTLENQAYNQAVEKAWKSPRDSSTYAEALIDQGDLDKAIEYAKKGLANNPDHIASRLALAVAQTRRKEHVKDAADTVKDLLSKGTDLTPGLRVRTLVAAAEVALFAERPDDALSSANEALALDPGSHTALWAKARAQAVKKQPGALKTFQEATAAHKTAAAIYFDGAESLQANGDTRGALSLLASYENAFKGVTISTSDGRTVAWLARDEPYWLERGAILRAAGKADDAMAAYDKAIAVGGINLAKAHYAKGALYLGKKDYDKAGAELTLVTPPDGSGHLAEAYLALGDVFFAKKDYPSACQNYAFGLARMKGLQRPREKLNAVLNDVNKRLIAAHKPALAKQWLKEAKPIIQ
jgi:tetratricopeptide (TPR) repeat protein